MNDDTTKDGAGDGGRTNALARWAKRIGAGVLVTVGALVVATEVRQSRTFEADAPDIHASRDPAVIARGRYLVEGPAHCADCHGDPRAAESAHDVPLSGGRTFHLPVGVFYVPNITNHAEKGVGRYRDEDIARILRHAVRPDGRAVLPFMPFADLSDDDLGAVVSYLRTTEPVDSAPPPHEVSAVGHVVKAWVLTPRGPSAPPPKVSPSGPTVENGRYLAHSVANCVGCHTKMDMRTGALVGPIFAGGATHPSTSDPTKSFVTPNLTPDERWGWITSWSEDAFVARMHAGRAAPGSPMPWASFQRMSDDDLRGIYRYLRTVPKAGGGPDPQTRETVVLTATK